MLIDFHTHAYTDALAERAMSTLMHTADIAAYTNGTISDLSEKLTSWNIDYGVMLPIATKPSQQKKINDWAAEVNGGRIISYGTVHPYAEDLIEEIHRLKDLGLKGIKLHPDYQGVYLFDDKMHPLYKEAELLDLPIIIHMGYDPVCPFERHAMPYHLLEVAEKYPKLKIIGAHMGGMKSWEEVYYYICGIKNIWLDTSYTSGEIVKDIMLKIIKKHGADRILFGSDLPWHKPEMELALIEELGLSSEEKEKIYYKNAVDLLKL